MRPIPGGPASDAQCSVHDIQLTPTSRGLPPIHLTHCTQVAGMETTAAARPREVRTRGPRPSLGDDPVVLSLRAIAALPVLAGGRRPSIAVDPSDVPS